MRKNRNKLCIMFFMKIQWLKSIFGVRFIFSDVNLNFFYLKAIFEKYLKMYA